MAKNDDDLRKELADYNWINICEHSITQLVRRTFSDGSKHIVHQCTNCGHQIGSPLSRTLAKHEFDISIHKLKEFDDLRTRRWERELEVGRGRIYREYGKPDPNSYAHGKCRKLTENEIQREYGAGNSGHRKRRRVW